jgi:hypothetical protein
LPILRLQIRVMNALVSDAEEWHDEG